MRTSKLQYILMAGVSAMVLSGTAHAQESDEIIVTGIKSSLKQSLDLKRDANQVVDAISAEDVGKFPDNNIAESLQRITGVSIQRTGGDGQFITVRGLGPEFNTVLVNGRTFATDNNGREFSFDVLAADLIQKAEVFKSATPTLQSGGIGSVVNISTPKPFDISGTRLSVSAAGEYDTLREEISPEFSGVGSWTNDNDTFGVLGSISYQDRKSQRDGFDGVNFVGLNASNAFNADVNGTGQLAADTINPNAAGAFYQNFVAYEREIQSRERIVMNGVVQARLSDTVEVTLDGIYSQFNIDSKANRFTPNVPRPILNPVIDANGTVTAYDDGNSIFLDNNPDIPGSITAIDNIARKFNRMVDSYQFGGNVKWDASDDLSFNLDLSTSKATRDGFSPFIVVGQQASVANPLRYEGASNDGIPAFTNLDQHNLTDLSLQRAHFTRVSNDTVDDEIFEARLDGRWEADKGPFEALTFGAFLNNREKQFQRITSQFARCAFCGYDVPFDQSALGIVELDGFLEGVDGAQFAPSSFVDIDIDAALAFQTSLAALNDPRRRSSPSTADLLANADGPQGVYTPQLLESASFHVEERVKSVFLNTEWGGDFGGDLPWTANFGARLAHTETISTGVDQPVNGFVQAEGDVQVNVLRGASTPVTVKNDYLTFLPSANLKLEVADDKILRFGVSKTVTRPTLTALGVNNTFTTNNIAILQSGGGNPELEAFESINYDAGFEWYFSDVGFFGINGFHKSFGEFIESQTLIIERPVTLNSTSGGGTTNLPFADTRQRNGEEGSITGVELALQHSLENGFGAALNYTYVTSDIERDASSAAQDCDYNGLSPHSFNVNGFYEKGPIQARVAYNYRDAFLVQCFAGGGQPRNREAFGQVDFSAQYAVNDMFTVFAEGINILGADTRDFSVYENRALSYDDFGSRFKLGVRADF